MNSLKLNACSSNKLETIFQQAPQLRSLAVSFDIFTWKSQVILPANRLTRLDLSDRNSSLQHLNLKIVSSMNLCNGHRWEKL